MSFNGLPTLNKKDFQDFLKRYRKSIPNSKLKYYMAGEYGDQTERPHYHAIMFNLPKLHSLDSVHIERAWKHGTIHIAPVNMATINYTLKYIMKGRWKPKHDYDDRQPNFSLMSKGLGSNHLTPEMMKYHREHKQAFVTLEGGIKTAMPRYFKDQIFSGIEKKVMSKTAKIEADKLDEKRFKSEKDKVEWKNSQIRKADKKLREKGTL